MRTALWCGSCHPFNCVCTSSISRKSTCTPHEILRPEILFSRWMIVPPPEGGVPVFNYPSSDRTCSISTLLEVFENFLKQLEQKQVASVPHGHSHDVYLGDGSCGEGFGRGVSIQSRNFTLELIRVESGDSIFVDGYVSKGYDMV